MHAGAFHVSIIHRNLTWFVCLFIEGLYSPANLTGSPQGFYKTSTLHKQYKHNPKVSPFSIALIKNGNIKLGDAGTTDHFGLAHGVSIPDKKKR